MKLDLRLDETSKGRIITIRPLVGGKVEITNRPDFANVLDDDGESWSMGKTIVIVVLFLVLFRISANDDVKNNAKANLADIRRELITNK